MGTDVGSHDGKIRLLYSFPLRIGAGRISATAWEQAKWAALSGVDVTVASGGVARALPDGISIHETLGWGRLRIPYRSLGIRRASMLHDWRVSEHLRANPDRYDVVHGWPLGSLRTFQVARHIGVPSLLERPNVHTALAYELVLLECERIGVDLPKGSEHAFDAKILEREISEYLSASKILCPSEQVAQSFTNHGYPEAKLLRHIRGYDPEVFFPPRSRQPSEGLTVLFAGHAAVRKGLHIALDAWLTSRAAPQGRFIIAGTMLPSYENYLGDWLSHPSVEVVGQSSDIASLMRQSDILVLPSIEEGFGRVIVEAMACGAVPLVSNACTDECVHGSNSLVHGVGDVCELREQFSSLHLNRSRLRDLSMGAVESSRDLTWERAAARTVELYRAAATFGMH